ncbi:MAG TPA: signal peptidase I [Gammaproteobacteria bacterium]|nr:signal peptidase I [Candidatus Parabeggiatoa sp.]HAI68252.1 signal peptidase I [Gammaproteobacteria bacterium]
MTWNWDLATILVLLIFVSGLIWLYDKIFLAPRRAWLKANLSVTMSEAERLQANEIPFIVDLARSLFPVFLIVLVLRSFMVEPFRIPSGSMMPTLLIGDFILVNKFNYGIRLPVLNTKVFEIGKPQRGDVVVFRYPEDPSIPFIKRVVGLPGDLLEYHADNKMLYINNEPVTQTVQGRYIGIGQGSNMTGREERIEDLPGAKHAILVTLKRNTNEPEIKKWTIPDNEYVVLGDNRDNSKDSRYWGTVPEENLIGQAFFIWLNWDFHNGGINWQRLGTTIE